MELHLTKEEVAKMIDHTLLRPDAKSEEIINLCKDASRFNFASVCINPSFVSLAKNTLSSENCNVKVCTVIGFPLGATTSSSKAYEACDAVKNGADEIDMVINIGLALEKRFDEVENDIKCVAQAIKDEGLKLNRKVLLKVILETCFLTDEIIAECCKCAVNAGADFVKTSTGFATPKDSDGKPLFNGATVHHIKLMRDTVGADFGVKASGGIRTAQDALKMIEAGANRIGTSSGVKILEGM